MLFLSSDSIAVLIDDGMFLRLYIYIYYIYQG